MPSLFDVVERAWVRCLRPLASGRCPICTKRLLPSDVLQLAKVPKGMQVRVVVHVLLFITVQLPMTTETALPWSRSR